METQLDKGKNVLVNYQAESGEHVQVVSGVRLQNVFRFIKSKDGDSNKTGRVRMFYVDVYADGQPIERYGCDDISSKELPFLKSQLEELAEQKLSSDELILNINEFLGPNNCQHAYHEPDEGVVLSDEEWELVERDYKTKKYSLVGAE